MTSPATYGAIEPDYTRDDSLAPPVPGVLGPSGYFVFVEHRRDGVNIGEYWLAGGPPGMVGEVEVGSLGVTNIEVQAGDVLLYHPRRSRTHPHTPSAQDTVVVQETPDQTHVRWAHRLQFS